MPVIRNLVTTNLELRSERQPLRRVSFASIIALAAVAGATLTLGCGGQRAPVTAAGVSPQVSDPALQSGHEHLAEGTPQTDKEGTPPTAPVPLRYPRSTTPWLGVELRALAPESAGVEVTRVLPGSPADKARLRPGDVLLTLNDTPAQSPADVGEWVRAQDVDETFPLTVMRDGKTHLVRTSLEGMPEFEDRLRLALVGRKAPEISGVATFQGEASSLRELRGQVVVLEFWASYCGVCRFLAPRLDSWHRTFRPQGATVMGITVDPPNVGRRVAQATGMSYTLASDTEARVSNAYLATQIPALVIIDRTGVVRDAMVGYSEPRLRETELLIKRLLGD